MKCRMVRMYETVDTTPCTLFQRHLHPIHCPYQVPNPHTLYSQSIHAKAGLQYINIRFYWHNMYVMLVVGIVMQRDMKICMIDAERINLEICYEHIIIPASSLFREFNTELIACVGMDGQ